MILARYIGEPIQKFLSNLLVGKMGLTLNAKKTRMLDLRERGTCLDFLGYTFRFDRSLKGGRDYLNLFPSKKSLARRRGEVKLLTRRQSSRPLTSVVAELNRKHLGWGRYFCLGYPSKSFNALDDYTRMRLGRFARTRSQRRMKLAEGETLYCWTKSVGLIRLGDPKVIAHLRGHGDLPQTYR